MKLAKNKKVKFAEMELKNRSVDEAEKEVMDFFKAARLMGKDKIDVKFLLISHMDSYGFYLFGQHL